jgi:hypothetical protein
LGRAVLARLLGLRAAAGFFAAVLFAAVLLAALLFLAAPLFLVLAVLRFALLLRAVELFARAAGLAELEPPSSSDHLPDSTRCAASATASAINVPRRLALDITLVAACEAESAASRPASRILRRAAGLALIAEAAAASPAPSISRLIAALAILSTVVFLDFEEVFFELDFAIADPPFDGGKTLQVRISSRRAATLAQRHRLINAFDRCAACDIAAAAGTARASAPADSR